MLFPKEKGLNYPGINFLWAEKIALGSNFLQGEKI